MTKLDDGKQDVNDKAHLNDFQASRAPLPPFLPCSFCNIVVPSSNFELHEVISLAMSPSVLSYPLYIFKYMITGGMQQSSLRRET